MPRRSHACMHAGALGLNRQNLACLLCHWESCTGSRLVKTDCSGPMEPGNPAAKAAEVGQPFDLQNVLCRTALLLPMSQHALLSHRNLCSELAMCSRVSLMCGRLVTGANAVSPVMVGCQHTCLNLLASLTIQGAAGFDFRHKGNFSVQVD